jgi:hypothetical protein
MKHRKRLERAFLNAQECISVEFLWVITVLNNEYKKICIKKSLTEKRKKVIGQGSYG